MRADQDCCHLLQRAQDEAKELESAIGTILSELREIKFPSKLGEILHEEHTRLCELRKMKEDQIGILIKRLPNSVQQQASL